MTIIDEEKAQATSAKHIAAVSSMEADIEKRFNPEGPMLIANLQEENDTLRQAVEIAARGLERLGCHESARACRDFL